MARRQRTDSVDGQAQMMRAAQADYGELMKFPLDLTEPLPVAKQQATAERHYKTILSGRAPTDWRSALDRAHAAELAKLMVLTDDLLTTISETRGMLATDKGVQKSPEVSIFSDLSSRKSRLISILGLGAEVKTKETMRSHKSAFDKAADTIERASSSAKDGLPELI